MDELSQQPVEQDQSLAGAVGAMPDIEALERGQSVDRGTDGQFKSREQEPAQEAEPAKKEPEVKAEEAEAEDDYIELPPEAEGSEPVRYKLQDVLDGYKKSQTLEADLAKAREAQPPPTHYEEAIVNATTQAQQYLQGLQKLQQWMQPQMPDVELVNPNSGKYNPEAYHQQLQQAQQVVALRQQLAEEAERVKADTSEKERVVLEARMSREKAEALKAWPELQDKTVRSKVVQDFAAQYKFSPEEVKAIGDHRVLSVIKDALAYRQSLAAKETAIRVVSAKPKLVKGQARNQPSGKEARYAAASERLTKSNSLDDAADAIGALLG